MKLSLAWIFDHINANWQDQDVKHIFARFNAVTAEIDHVHTIDFHMDNFALCKVIKQNSNEWHVSIPEFGKEATLPVRTMADAISPKITDHYYMLKREAGTFLWASLADFGVDKGGLLPALDATDQMLDGSWKKSFEHRDIILEVDNKSITHRPDMWGHRGFAREIAAFLNLPLRPESEFLAKLPVINADKQSQPTRTTPIVIENHASQICTRFTGLYFSSIENKPSNIFVTSRLLKVDSRPINGIVDMTNYVMLDWSKPVHAYDAEKIANKTVVIRMAKDKEKLLLLDGNELSLTPEDLVIADAKKPMCLGGIKGGANDSVTAATTSIFLESAHFGAGFIRKAALRHKTRTDSSARFEKTLDPNQTTQSQLRFIKLLEQFNIKATHAEEIVAVGPEAKEEIIEVTHAFLEKRSGLSFTEADVVEPLTRLGFKVLKSFDASNNVLYMISVPSFRSSKDVKIKEDILEEVVRCYGFERIKLELQKIERRPFNLSPIMRLRKIKTFLAGAARMTEQQNYAFFDEANLTTLGLQPETVAHLVNPISENYYRLITSHIPALCKNIHENHMHQESLAFFEFGRVWLADKEHAVEQKRLSGIIFEKRKQVDFYASKAMISELLLALGFVEKDLLWKKTEKADSWYNQYQTADIFYGNKKIGTFGKADPLFLRKLDVLPESDAVIFDLDGDLLTAGELATKRYVPASKFQETYVDLSLMVPVSVTADALHKKLASTDPVVKKVELIDFFEKAEWTDVRSLTFRVWLSHDEKTLEKHEIDAVWQKAVAHVQALGAQIRA